MQESTSAVLTMGLPALIPRHNKQRHLIFRVIRVKIQQFVWMQTMSREKRRVTDAPTGSVDIPRCLHAFQVRNLYFQGEYSNNLKSIKQTWEFTG